MQEVFEEIGEMIIRTAHLFSGIEGFRYGLERSAESFTDNQGRTPQYGECAFHTIYSNDFDKYASAITRRNYPDGTHHEADIRTIDTSTIPDCDLITFGWPCQDNSIAGQRRGQREGTRSGLLFEAVRIIRVKQPRYFIAENVPGLFSVTQGQDFYEAIRLFTESGYDVQWQVLNTRWFLPQNRERIIFVGHLRGTSRPQIFPIGEAGTAYPESDVEAVDNCLDSNYHKGWLDHGQRSMICVYDDKKHQQNRRYDSAGISPCVDTPSGGHHMPKIVQRQPLKFLGRNQRNIEGDYAFAVDGMNTNGISICIDSNYYKGVNSNSKSQATSRGLLLPENQIRRLTPIECERLQGFPDNWTKIGIFNERPTRKDLIWREKNPDLWAYHTKMFGSSVNIRIISDTQRYKCCGNAVSTPVIQAVGIKLLEAIKAGMPKNTQFKQEVS